MNPTGAGAHDSQWIAIQEQAPDILAANLETIENHPALHPHLRDIQSALGSLFLRKGPAGGAELAVQEDQAIKPLALIPNEAQWRPLLQRNLSQFAGPEHAAVIWVLGCDLGYSLPDLAAHLRTAHQKLAFIIEPELKFFAATLALFPLQQWLASNRARWAIGPGWLQTVAQRVDRDHLFSVPVMETLPSATAMSPPRRQQFAPLPNHVKAARTDAAQRFDQQVEQTIGYYQQKDATEINTLLAINLDDDPSKAIPSIQRRFLETCQDRGLRVIDHRPGFRSDIGLIRSLCQERPDALLFINRVPAHFARPDLLERMRLPRIIWLIDDPNCFVEERFTPHDFVFTWDEAYRETLLHKGAQAVDWFPYVADLDQSEAQTLERFTAPVSYIGQVKRFDPAEYGLDDATARLVHAVAAQKAQAPLADYAQLVYAQQTQFGLSLLESPHDEVPASVRYAIYILANAQRRIAVLQQVQPFGLRIYGNEDWLAYIRGAELEACYQGPADPATEVPHIFRSSAINLNIHSLQALNSLNQRDFNCPLVGGFLLTDWVAGADRFFEPGQELIFYQDPESLPGLIEHYLSNPAERQAVIARGQQRVLREHTYAARVPKVLDTLKQRIQERYESG